MEVVLVKKTLDVISGRIHDVISGKIYVGVPEVMDGITEVITGGFGKGS